jgi:hypothetical protein
MLTFTPITLEHHALLRKYYAGCDYHLCEYSAGTKLMWSLYLRPSFAEEAGCLIVRNRIDGEWVFDFPVPGPDGDVDAALTAIESYCTDTETPLVISVVPEEKAPELLLRWPRLRMNNERNWKDYLYRAEDMAAFAGRKYSGQRNHINKFRKEYPTAKFVPLTGADMPLIENFWADYEQEFQKTSFNAKRELAYAKALARLLPEGWLLGGGLLVEDRLVAMSLAENCGGTLIIHVEKALYSHQGLSHPGPGLCRPLRRRLRLYQPGGRRRGPGPADLQAAVSAGAPGREAAVRGPVRGGPPAGDPHRHHPPADPDGPGGAGRGRL